MESLDLLNPSDLSEHYRHQLRQTMSAYNPTQIVIGEALQNAIDAIVEADDGVSHEININLDLDQSAVTVTDDGGGFPNDPSLLFLGGGTKRCGNPKLFGLVGVGIKVVLFSSQKFSLRANSDKGAFRYEILDAYKFENDPPPDLKVPSQFSDDPSPLSHGTEVHYRFPDHVAENPIGQFIQNMCNQCLPRGNDLGLGKTLKSAVRQGIYENRFAGLMATFLRRYTYAGDVLNLFGGKQELSNTTIHIHVTCSNPLANFEEEISELFDEKTQFSFNLSPEYLLASDTRNWASQEDRLGLFHDSLGRGGTNLERTSRGINICSYANEEDYEKLITDKDGEFPRAVKESIKEYREKLFPKVNGIFLTIGRIPHFEEFLPGGSQRVISANGVVTTHKLDLTRGLNQEYVRCFDLVIDVDSTLNYGKSQLSQLNDPHMVNRIRRFVDDAYATTIQTATSLWVGKEPRDDDEQYNSFLNREDLNLPQLASKKVPEDENDVIALFFELLGKEYIKGYESFGLSQKDRYDGRFMIRQNANENPPVPPTDDRQFSTVEFKTKVDTLFREFEHETKDPKDLKLVIAWTEGTLTSNRFTFADIEYSRYPPERVYPAVTRYLHDTRSGTQIQVLLLKSVVDGIKEKERAE